ncbi:hypothetical protein Goklo_001870 [Gossypium klotzschianum]|uniref:Uncharacterized protein n=1 Tax=Gossypium klotzschianum TaxID=34286 RepID=A0A7J8W1T2_9ROSI|nr:hypothetical protein [Gossypium klotzschianum]
MFPDLHNALSNACEAAGLRKKPEVIIIPTTVKVFFLLSRNGRSTSHGGGGGGKQPRVFAGIEDGQESGSGYSPLNDPSPNCSSPRPSGLLDDNSYEHWLIILNSQNAQNIWKKK